MHYTSNFILTPILLWLLICGQQTAAHGGVAFDDDVCKLNIGFLQAHFTVYQPLASASEEFCEDIPDATKSVFVMDYLHDFLKQMPVDFRIIKDTHNFGIFAKWDDIVGLGNDQIEADTVFYYPPVIQSDGALTVEYDFQEVGGYIGIVNAQHPTQEKTYHAVFFFQVGGSDWGYIPLFIALVVLAQGVYWFSSRRRSISTG
jgi:hypothetical protein